MISRHLASNHSATNHHFILIGHQLLSIHVIHSLVWNFWSRNLRLISGGFPVANFGLFHRSLKVAKSSDNCYNYATEHHNVNMPTEVRKYVRLLFKKPLLVLFLLEHSFSSIESTFPIFLTGNKTFVLELGFTRREVTRTVTRRFAPNTSEIEQGNEKFLTLSVLVGGN